LKRFVCYLLALVLVLSFSVTVSAQETIKLGANLEMTGAVAAYGQMIWEGALLAQEMVPEVLGKPVEFILVDNKSDRVETANAQIRLIDRDNVVAILGPATSGNMLAAGPISEENQIPVISATATLPIVTEGREFVFRACFLDPYQAAAASQFAIEDMGVQTVAVFPDIAQDYCIGLANFFKEAFIEQGGTVVAEQFCRTGDQDFSAQLTTIMAANPDLIYIPNYYTETALIVRQARDLGYEGMILGADGIDVPELVDVGGEAVNGIYFTAHADTTRALTEVGQQYFDLYREKYGREPAVFGALAADAYLMKINAIERAGSLDPVAIRNELEATENLEVVTGTVTVTAGNITKPVVVKQVVDGNYEFVKAVTP